jgi:hypothetical protein
MIRLHFLKWKEKKIEIQILFDNSPSLDQLVKIVFRFVSFDILISAKLFIANASLYDIEFFQNFVGT